MAMESATLASMRRRKMIYSAGFLFATTAAIPAYIFSDYLSQFFGKSVGIVYSVSAIASIFVFMWLSSLLQRFGNYKIMLASLFAGAGATALLPIFDGKLPALAFFVVIYVSGMVAAFNIDIFLEKESSNEKTGTIRGNFLSAVNLAWIVSPFIAGHLLQDGRYENVFWVSAFVFLPVAAIVMSNFRHFVDSPYTRIAMKKILMEMPYHQNTSKIMLSNFILQFFFAWMVIYMPIYLKEYVGFSWKEIGVMFTIMLTPFVLLEAPLGRLADKKYGEKEMLSIGFVVMAIFTILLAFIPGKNFIIWTAILFATRVGASMVEIMNETYFFKKNSDQAPDIVGVFRLTRPLAYLIAPIIATTLLFVIDYSGLFIVLGILMLYGLRYSLSIKDTM